MTEDEEQPSIREQAQSLREALADEVDAPAEQDDHATRTSQDAGTEDEEVENEETGE